jgi:hypothetical protein
MASDKLSLESALRKFVRRWYELGEEWRRAPAEEREEILDAEVEAIARKLVSDHFDCDPNDL